jgi:hypothetical protein
LRCKSLHKADVPTHLVNVRFSNRRVWVKRFQAVDVTRGLVAKQRGISMILGMSVGAFTILHVIITLVAIGSGLIVVGGMFASDRLPVTTALFLFTTALTSVTGFLFPIHGFTPALRVLKSVNHDPLPDHWNRCSNRADCRKNSF